MTIIELSEHVRQAIQRGHGNKKVVFIDGDLEQGWEINHATLQEIESDDKKEIKFVLE